MKQNNYRSAYYRSYFHAYFSFVLQCFLLFFPAIVFSQDIILSGTVTDLNTGKTLSGVTVRDLSTLSGTLSDKEGSFRLSLSTGDHMLVFSHVGYRDHDTLLHLRTNTRLDIILYPSDISLNEVTVTAEGGQDIVNSSGMSSLTLKKKDIMKMPSLLGETDPLGLLRFTPGVQSGSEGNVGFLVRGGGSDQNLILFDNALIYNPGHILGFFSAFNPDVIRDVNIMKSGIPARFGGKLSSVINVRSYTGNEDSLEITGNLGLISSRIAISGPLRAVKGTFIIAARHTYLELFAKPVMNSFVKNQTFFDKDNFYNFHDLNAGLTVQISPDDRLCFSAYTGMDNYALTQGSLNQKSRLKWGNTIVSARWSHNMHAADLSTGVSWTRYSFGLAGSQSDYSFGIFSSTDDFSLKSELTFRSGNHSFNSGIELTEHRFVPNRINATATGFNLNFGQFSPMNAIEAGLFAEDEINLGEQFVITAGVRYSLFSHHGPFTDYIKNPMEQMTDTVHYSILGSVAFYSNPEPRIIIKYNLDKTASLKASYMRIAQYVHLATSATVSLPTDIWLPSTAGVKPMTGNQLSMGYFRNLLNNRFEFSTEVYFKTMKNKPEFLRGIIYNSIFGDPVQNIVPGSGRAYGTEVYLRKKTGRLTGWVSYTLARTEQRFDEINSGLWYPAKYDRRHDIAVTISEKLNAKWDLSATFIFTSGNAYTIPVGRYIIQGNIVNQYGSVNSFRMPPYHRLDLSLSRKTLIMRHIPTELNFSIFNAYNRANPYFMYFEATGDLEDYSLKINPVVVSLFPVIPSVSWSFNF